MLIVNRFLEVSQLCQVIFPMGRVFNFLLTEQWLKHELSIACNYANTLL